MYVMIECGHKRLRLFKLMLDIRTVAVFGGLILIYIGYRYLIALNWSPMGIGSYGDRTKGEVDEPNPRHWQYLGLAASFPT